MSPKQGWRRSFALITGVVWIVGSASVARAEGPFSAASPVAGSPAAELGAALVEHTCPTFLWSAVEGAKAYEFVVYELAVFGATSEDGEESVPKEETLPPDGAQPDDSAANTKVALQRRLNGSFAGWTPSLPNCLKRGGQYAWLVRAETENGVTDWSQPALFQVAEVSRTVQVLSERVSALMAAMEQEGDSALTDSLDGADPTASGAAPLLLSDHAVAVLGSSPDATGTTTGVRGHVASPDGVGVDAANEAGGADLRLDGSLNGATDTLLTEAGLDRPSTDAETFAFTNSGGGSLDVSIGGDSIVTTATDQDTTYDAGNQLNLNGTTFDVVEGSGSGLDADTLDGADASTFATGAALTAHTTNVANPHSVTANQTTPMAAKGQLESHDGSQLVVLGPGADGQVLKADGATASGLAWANDLSPSGQTCPLGYFVTGFNTDGTVSCSPRYPVTNTVDTSSSGNYSSVAIGVDGLPVISYLDDSSGNGQLKIAYCAAHDCNATDGVTTTTADSSDGVGAYTSIAIGSDGLPIISYLDLINGALKVARCDGEECDAQTVDSGGVGEYSSIAIGSDGLPIISYFDDTNNALKVAHCNALDCNAAAGVTTTIVDSTGDVGAWSSIAIGSDGYPIISYFDDSNDDLKVAHCNELDCDGLGAVTTTTVDSVDSVGAATSIAIGSDGLPVIAYVEFTGGFNELKFAHCNAADCNATAGFTTRTMDVTLGFGGWTSIAVGVDGSPIISYTTGTLASGTLKVAHCGAVDCDPFGGITLTTLDGITPTTAPGTSIAIGSDGLPVVSYPGVSWPTALVLKVAKCVDVECRP